MDSLSSFIGNLKLNTDKMIMEHLCISKNASELEENMQNAGARLTQLHSIKQLS